MGKYYRTVWESGLWRPTDYETKEAVDFQIKIRIFVFMDSPTYELRPIIVNDEGNVSELFSKWYSGKASGLLEAISAAFDLADKMQHYTGSHGGNAYYPYARLEIDRNQTVTVGNPFSFIPRDPETDKMYNYMLTAQIETDANEEAFRVYLTRSDYDEAGNPASVTELAGNNYSRTLGSYELAESYVKYFWDLYRNGLY